eukprot:XP_001707208.1 Hypothetical protein GL50803_23016 [Giardia lamblia ATCC 50803]
MGTSTAVLVVRSTANGTKKPGDGHLSCANNYHMHSYCNDAPEQIS